MRYRPFIGQSISIVIIGSIKAGGVGPEFAEDVLIGTLGRIFGVVVAEVEDYWLEECGVCRGGRDEQGEGDN